MDHDYTELQKRFNKHVRNAFDSFDLLLITFMNYEILNMTYTVTST